MHHSTVARQMTEKLIHNGMTPIFQHQHIIYGKSFHCFLIVPARFGTTYFAIINDISFHYEGAQMLTRKTEKNILLVLFDTSNAMKNRQQTHSFHALAKQLCSFSVFSCKFFIHHQISVHFCKNFHHIKDNKIYQRHKKKIWITFVYLYSFL